MGLIEKIFGDPNKKIIQKLDPIIGKINSLEVAYQALSDIELKALTIDFKSRLSGINDLKEVEKKLEELLPEAFAVVREAAKRQIGQRHYDVQLIGGIILHRGQIAEMKTGEGKTLVATLPLYLNALTGKGVQLVTVNDYLSRVGAGWMAPVYDLLGLSTSVIINNASFIYDPEYNDETQYDKRLAHFKPSERKEAYKCDIVYGTNNEFGFDYLRDNMAPSLDYKVQRGFNYAIVDEVDSILIDEARTPLIISAPAEESTDKYYKYAQLVRRLIENEDYNVDEKMRAVTLSEAGIAKMEGWLGMGNIYVEQGIGEVHHIEQALKAEVIFKNERDYVIKEGEIIIVDEFTGRLMPGRRYSEGLHQAIEAKENVDIKRESRTLATVTFQNYFRMYNKLSGMTGTAVTEAEEFSKIYNLEAITIPTNQPVVRIDKNDLIYKTEDAKFRAVALDVKERHKKGQPILIGTISIEKNQVLAEYLKREGLDPEVLNAKNHEKEARIIADAGRVGAITLATNMAGRGVDIILGGPNGEEQARVKELGGLYVIGTERHESRRIDNQLRGRAGRQGDPGESRFYVSTEDDLMRIFGGDRMKNIMTTLRVPDDAQIENGIISHSIESAQKRVEGNNFDIRKHLLDYDDVLNKHRENIYRRRDEILSKAQSDPEALSQIILEMVESEIEQVVSFHTVAENIEEWNLQEVCEVVNTIFPVENNLKDTLLRLASDETKKLEIAMARTNIIESLVSMAKEKHKELKDKFNAAGFDWSDLEKGIVIRSMDNLWIDHLDAMTYLRRGIGLQGYGQRDPLVEYKREAYRMFGELNSLIDSQVVYSLFKLEMISQGMTEGLGGPSLLERARSFSGAAKTMDEKAGVSENIHTKTKDAEGNKVGRNDSCPCGSGKKYKRCCGA